jgi:hypothetical protein
MDNSMQRLVVCAAIRHKDSGIIICGPRHGNCLNACIQLEVDLNPSGETWQCGFVDQRGKFMSREEAWEVADAAGQIRRPHGYERDYSKQRTAGVGDKGMLFSENLY